MPHQSQSLTWCVNVCGIGVGRRRLRSSWRWRVLEGRGGGGLYLVASSSSSSSSRCYLILSQRSGKVVTVWMSPLLSGCVARRPRRQRGRWACRDVSQRGVGGKAETGHSYRHHQCCVKRGRDLPKPRSVGPHSLAMGEGMWDRGRNPVSRCSICERCRSPCLPMRA